MGVGGELRMQSTQPTAFALEEPTWIPDGQIRGCMNTKCSKSFSILTRKHHCRFCGKVFCGACSERRMNVWQMGYIDNVRVCDICANEVRAREQFLQEDIPYLLRGIETNMAVQEEPGEREEADVVTLKLNAAQTKLVVIDSHKNELHSVPLPSLKSAAIEDAILVMNTGKAILTFEAVSPHPQRATQRFYKCIINGVKLVKNKQRLTS